MTGKEKSDKKAFFMEVGDHGVAIITFDLPDEEVNKLSSWIIKDLEVLMDEVENRDDIKAVVLISGKKDNFIVGADLKELQLIDNAEQAIELVHKGQEMLSRIEKSKKPVVAAIHGPALGGGCETALACHYRLCTDDPKTVIGLPEVQLGLLPAAGGTQRLPRLVGVQKALDMMLTGRSIRPKQAKKMGLVDEVVYAPKLKNAARSAALKLAEGKIKVNRPGQKSLTQLITDFSIFSNPKALLDIALEDLSLGRYVLFDQATKTVYKKTKGLYPAPERIIYSVKTGLEKGLTEGFKAEREAFGALIVSDVSKQLRNIFFATQQLKKEKWGIPKKVKPMTVNTVGILGAGFMGAGIATVLAEKQFQVRVRDINREQIGKLYHYVHKVFHKGVRKKWMSRAEYERRMGRITAATDYSGFHHLDMVIEAVFENLELKHQVIREVEEIIPETAVFASNTSSIPISTLAEASQRPEQFIGMHFFSPVEKMPLLEIIVTPQTSKKTLRTCVEVGRTMGKHVIVVNDGTGFYTSRILAPYAREAAYLLMDGVAIEEIDGAAKELGFPVGPITLLDEVGIDVVYKVGPVMHKAFGDRFAPIPAMERLIKDNRLGRKNKRGFYRYNGKKKEPDTSVYKLFPEVTRKAYPRHKIKERLLYSFMNEAALCLQEHILKSPRDGDVGAIFGLGFPPYTGGPFRHMDTLGVKNVVQKLEKLEQEFGLRFQAAQILRDMAKSEKTFYKD